MQNGRQVVVDSLNHRQPSRMALDFGATSCSGIHCSVVAELRKHYGLDQHPVKVHEAYQMLGLVEDDLAEAMGVDTVMAQPITNHFGVPLDDKWKEWKTLWGQDVLIPAGMEIEITPDGQALTYPQGDRSAPASGRMPSSGYFFDTIIRQEEFDEDDPDPRDNTEEFTLLTDEQIDIIKAHADAVRGLGRAVVTALPNTNLGDIAAVPAAFLKRPKGIRDIAEWYMSVVARPEFMHEIFSYQTDIALENFRRVLAAVGPDAYDAVFICGTDFGTQISTFCSVETFHEIYIPYYKKLNGWIHDNTPWKTLKHSCGAVEGFFNSFIEAGFDILNPVQCSATGMDPEHLKKTYGDRIVFWGGGVDTQKTLPFGTPEEVRKEVLDRCRIFSPGGGFVFNAIHNVQARTPTENMVALLEAVKEFNQAGK
ncbi:MAG: hypothetical protein LUC93_13535 [Planctomycetaceae bacterium]|nr:hypothetical protein [Planctomycetaceae bacterium]